MEAGEADADRRAAPIGLVDRLGHLVPDDWPDRIGALVVSGDVLQVARLHVLVHVNVELVVRDMPDERIAVELLFE